MNKPTTTLHRSSLRACGVVAFAGAMLTAALPASAHAADTDSNVQGVSDAQLVELGERMTATRRQVTTGLTALLGAAVSRSASEVGEVRDTFGWALTFGHGLEGLAALDVSALYATDDEQTADSAADSRRLDYVSETSDPLAGL
ncbi:MAG: hypothetical protein K0V04_28880 [Deltaproteobacteria bacterium]|nr:hypothetical protein [Deltaproteobacteria bacterium]